MTNNIIKEYYNWLKEKTNEYSLNSLTDNNYASGIATDYVVAFEKLNSLMSYYNYGDKI